MPPAEPGLEKGDRKRYFLEAAWLGAVARSVLVEIAGDRIIAVAADAEAPPDAVALPGFTIPGLVNAHSHAFHRALRGRTQSGSGDFWTWREQMYLVAGALDPDGYHALARAAYGEMALAGITTVGEFHYLHHGPGGVPYQDANAMSHALVAAAADAGIRLTLLDTCYLRAGFDDDELTPIQRRFSDGDAGRWSERTAALEESRTVLRGAAIHSVRAVDELSAARVARWAGEHTRPLHLHLSEQRSENGESRTATGLSPARLVERAGVLGPLTTAVHATHLDPDDVSLLGATRTRVCLCPTTERDLADGIGPARAMAAGGSPLSLGTDSHAIVDMFEESRAVELDERLVTGRRGLHPPTDLLEAATTGGAASLGWDDAGELAPGRLADFTTVSLSSPRTAGGDPDDPVAQLVFAASAADVTDVVVGGREVVRNGVHRELGDVGGALAAAIADVWQRSEFQ